MIREGPALRRLLEAAPNLRSLEWQYFFSEDPLDQDNSWLIDLSRLGIDLSQVRRTLTSLTIRRRDSSTVDRDDHGSFSYIGSLAALLEFHCLRRLDIDLEILAARRTLEGCAQLKNIIPSCLEELDIAHDPNHGIHNGWDAVSIYSLLEAWLSGFEATRSKLRRVTVELQDSDSTNIPKTPDLWSTATCRKYRALFRNHGLEVKFLAYRQTEAPELCDWLRDV